MQALLRDERVLADLKRRGDNIAKAADAKSGESGGHIATEFVGKNRGRVEVKTITAKAMVSEATNRTLTASLDAGRT